MKEKIQTFIIISIFSVLLMLLGAVIFHQSTNKMEYGSPKEREQHKILRYETVYCHGNIESIHIGGRTEVVPIKKIRITRYSYKPNLYIIDGDIEQPPTRKNYFMPSITVNVDKPNGTYFQFDEPAYDEPDGEDNWKFAFQDQIITKLIVKDGFPTHILHRHARRYKGDKEYKPVAEFEAEFTNDTLYETYKNFLD